MTVVLVLVVLVLLTVAVIVVIMFNRRKKGRERTENQVYEPGTEGRIGSLHNQVYELTEEEKIEMTPNKSYMAFHAESATARRENDQSETDNQDQTYEDIDENFRGQQESTYDYIEHMI